MMNGSEIGIVCSSALQLLIGLHLASDTLRSPVTLFLHTRLDIDESAIRWHFGHHVRRFESYLEIPSINTAETLFVDSDVASLAPIWAQTKAQIFVYEEGVGTYSLSTDDSLGPGTLKALKWTLLDVFLGYGIRLGESKCTSGVYVYCPHIYQISRRRRAKPTFPINGRLCDFLTSRYNDLHTVFNITSDIESHQLQGRDIILLLTDWSHATTDDIHFANKEVAEKKKPLLALKRHPRSSGVSAGLFDLELPAHVPLELLLVDLVNANPSSLTILHKGSSCVLYTGEWPIEFKFLPSTSQRVRQMVLEVIEQVRRPSS